MANIYRYECPPEQWTEFINVMRSGKQFENLASHGPCGFSYGDAERRTSGGNAK